MHRTLGTFGYTVNKTRNAEQGRVNPLVHICLEHWLDETVSHAPQVTPDLTSATEIDEYVKLLKDDLDGVAKEAKLALVKAKKAEQEMPH